MELIIIDESERLHSTALEVLRDGYDRNKVAPVLIGISGIEEQFIRYPQLYSKVGFAHEYRALPRTSCISSCNKDGAPGQTQDLEDFTDAQAIAAIARIMRGNFRLIERFFTQMQGS